MNALRTVLATLALFTVVVPATLVFAAVAVVGGLLDRSGRTFFRIARVWSRFLLTVLRVRVVAEVDPATERRTSGPGSQGEGMVFVANHQSYMDIPAIFATMPTPLVFATKAELFRIPVFGGALKAGGFIPVYRGDRSRGKMVFDRASERLHAGGSLLFFPEGTRTGDGRIGRFRRGAFVAALAAGAPVVPLGIDGALDVLHRHRLVVRPGTIRVRYGAPVESAEYGAEGREAMQVTVRRRVSELAGRPLAPVKPGRAGLGSREAPGEAAVR